MNDWCKCRVGAEGVRGRGCEQDVVEVDVKLDNGQPGRRIEGTTKVIRARTTVRS